MNYVIVFTLLWLTLIIYLNFQKIRAPILFIHIPKTGGNAIKNTKFFKKCKYFGHARISNVKQIDKYKYSFAVVRNPYDRLVSAYFYLKKGGEPNNGYDKGMQSKLQKYKSFKEFVKDLSLFIHEIHFKPQYSFVCDKNNRVIVNNILKMETLDRDFNKLLKSNFVLSEVLSKVNASVHANYKQYFDEETKHIVYKVYERDFKIFKYT